jgi:hypothetical protein
VTPRAGSAAEEAMAKTFGGWLALSSARKSVGMTAAAIAILLLGSSQSPVLAAEKPAKLSQIFVPAMLEAKVASFEKTAGPAWKIVPGPGGYAERRIYKIEKCEVEAAIGNGTVNSLHLKLSDRCTFELAAFFAAGRRLPTASKLTVGEAERALGTGPVVGICLIPCGHAYRPAVYEHIEGSPSDRFVDTVLEVAMVDDVAIRAAAMWTKVPRDDSGKKNAKDTRFNCNHRYDDTAHKLFDKIRITAIRIGYNFTEPWQCD